MKFSDNIKAEADVYSLIIVEDEDDSRRGLMEYIPWKDFGFYPLKDFPDADSALAYLSSSSPDVLLTDIMMPGMDGITLIEKAKAIRPDMIPVVLSGYSDFDYARRCISLGVREYILKPAGLEELREVFSRIHDELGRKDSKTNKLSPAELVSDMQTFIKDTLSTVSLKSLSDKFSLNQYYISEIFHQHAGVSFQEYAASERMNAAMDLLASSSLPIAAISEKVGYTSPSSFTRSFREKNGMTPKEYREKLHAR